MEVLALSRLQFAAHDVHDVRALLLFLRLRRRHPSPGRVFDARERPHDAPYDTTRVAGKVRHRHVLPEGAVHGGGQGGGRSGEGGGGRGSGGGGGGGVLLPEARLVTAHVPGVPAIICAIVPAICARILVIQVARVGDRGPEAVPVVVAVAVAMAVALAHAAALLLLLLAGAVVVGAGREGEEEEEEEGQEEAGGGYTPGGGGPIVAHPKLSTPYSVFGGGGGEQGGEGQGQCHSKEGGHGDVG